MARLQSESFNRNLLIIGILLICFSSQIADLVSIQTKINSWVIGVNLYRFNFLLIIISLRKEAKSLVGKIGYRIIFYILINHFIDRYYGYNSWSWNDAITLATIEIETTILWLKKKKNEIHTKAN